MSGDFSKNGPKESAGEPTPDAPGGRRLPPPAFPPGSRRSTTPRAPVEADDLSGAFISPDDPIPDRAGDVPGDAFISPDAPIVRTRTADDAFISPDAPIPHRPPRTSPVAVDDDEDLDEGVVTGMGDDAHMDPTELALGFDPHVLEVVDKVAKLAEALKQKGEAGLRSTPGMGRFEATLRSYCVGYLAGRRAEEDEGGGPPTAM